MLFRWIKKIWIFDWKRLSIQTECTWTKQFDYSLLGKVLTKGLSKDAQNKGLFKRLENIKGKNEELLNEFRRANEVSKTAKYESEYNYDSKDAFYKFYRDFEDFKRMASMDSKHGKLIEFYNLLGEFVENHKAFRNKKKTVKIEFWITSIHFMINTLMLTKKEYDNEDLEKKDETWPWPV